VVIDTAALDSGIANFVVNIVLDCCGENQFGTNVDELDGAARVTINTNGNDARGIETRRASRITQSVELDGRETGERIRAEGFAVEIEGTTRRTDGADGVAGTEEVAVLCCTRILETLHFKGTV